MTTDQSSAAIDRIAPTRRPERSAIGYQTWEHLSFLHWRVEPAAVAKLLPHDITPRVEVDTFGGNAWVGLVPFAMRGIRPWWSPPVPGVSNFLETNVRTYVTVDGEPGVWFFSLDASSSLAVRIARWKWSLPYFRAEMMLKADSRSAVYQSERRWPEPTGVESTVLIKTDADSLFHADPDTLEHFLAERYLLFTVDGKGRLLRGQVYHTPYPLQTAEATLCEDELVRAIGLEVGSEPDHVLYARRVDVDIFPLEPLTRREP